MRRLFHRVTLAISSTRSVESWCGTEAGSRRWVSRMIESPGRSNSCSLLPVASRLVTVTCRISLSPWGLASMVKRSGLSTRLSSDTATAMEVPMVLMPCAAKSTTRSWSSISAATFSISNRSRRQFSSRDRFEFCSPNGLTPISFGS